MGEILRPNFYPTGDSGDSAREDTSSPENILDFNKYRNSKVEFPIGYRSIGLIPGLDFEETSYELSYYAYLDNKSIYTLVKHNQQLNRDEYFIWKEGDSKPSRFQFKVNALSALEYQVCDWINTVSNCVYEIYELSSIKGIHFVSDRNTRPFYSFIAPMKNVRKAIWDHRNSFESNFTFMTIINFIDLRLEDAGRIQQRAIDLKGEG